MSLGVWGEFIPQKCQASTIFVKRSYLQCQLDKGHHIHFKERLILRKPKIFLSESGSEIHS